MRSRRAGELRKARRRWLVPALTLTLGLTAMLAGCSKGPASSTTSSSAPISTSTSTSTSSSTSISTSTSEAPLGPDHQVWLCRPGTSPDPCTASLRTEVVQGSGATTIVSGRDAKRPKIDCFYVYPTVSLQSTANANLHIDSAETSVAIAQASRFSQACRVFAPMYRQVTVAAIFGQTHVPSDSMAIAYAGVLAAWKDYLARYNDGRGVVLIGHSQGSFLLEQLIKQQIDPSPTERRLLVSALLMGGNVTVPIGRDAGGGLNLPACASASQTGCVVAYSSFDHTPPANSVFGRTSLPGQKVLCVNPAALALGANGQGVSAVLDPYLPTHLSGLSAVIGALPSAPTPWVTYPNLFEARCEYAGGASWLDVTDIRKPGDHRLHLRDTLGPTWGLHLYDVNLALGDLVAIVGKESVSYSG